MKSVAPRNFALILGVALATLFTVPEAHAGTKEIAAINLKLQPLGKTIDTATDSELSGAVISAMKDPANSKLNQATIAAEALKGARVAINIGTQLSTDILADLANLPKVSANIQSFVGAASKSSATGTTANATQIPTWAAGFISRITNVVDRNAEAIAIASFASGSTTAIGAIIGGRTLLGDAEVTGDAKLIALANQAIQTKKLTSSVQQISQYVGDAATSASDFTVGVILATGSTGVNNTKYLAKIATGVTTSNPTAASDIVDAMYAGDNVSSPLFLATVKNSTTLAKSLGLVADAEEVSQLAAEFGDRVGKVNPSTLKVVGIKQTSINAIAKGLVTGLATRATGTGVNNLLRNSRTNRIDEIGEVGAYLFNAVSSLPDFKGLDNAGNPLIGSKLTAATKRATSIVNGLLKTAISASLKVHRDVATIPPTNPKTTLAKDTQFQATVADDIAGSVAQTIRALGTAYFGPGVYDALVASLTKTNTKNQPLAGKAIAGGSTALFNVGDGSKTIAQLVQDALAAGLNNTNNASKIYEDGTQAILAQGPYNDPLLGTLTEPETDIRSR